MYDGRVPSDSDAQRSLHSYSGYLRERYGGPVYRVAVDAGFCCPNRRPPRRDRRAGPEVGPSREFAGCLYCDGAGARAPYLASIRPPGRPDPADPLWREAVREQIRRGLGFLRRRYGAERFALYFQAFSSTYAPVRRLRQVYDFALGCGPFVELIVSTRPDCVDGPTASLLGEYRSPEREVWVELGLQSANDRTLRRIGRGHTVRDFDAAFRLLRRRGLRLAVHLIFGLPGEDREQILATLRHVAALRPDAVKIHNLHVCRDSPLFAQYLAGEITVPCAGRHLGYVLQALEMLPPETILMRLTCDTPPARLAAPLRFPAKAEFWAAVRREIQPSPGAPSRKRR